MKIERIIFHEKFELVKHNNYRYMVVFSDNNENWLFKVYKFSNWATDNQTMEIIWEKTITEKKVKKYYEILTEFKLHKIRLFEISDIDF